MAAGLTNHVWSFHELMGARRAVRIVRMPRPRLQFWLSSLTRDRGAMPPRNAFVMGAIEGAACCLAMSWLDDDHQRMPPWVAIPVATLFGILMYFAAKHVRL